MVKIVPGPLSLGLLGSNRFLTGTPWPGSPRPSYKNAISVAYNGKQMYYLVFLFQIGFSTIGRRNVKKGSIVPYKQMNFLFYVGYLGPGHFGPSLEQLILSS